MPGPAWWWPTGGRCGSVRGLGGMASRGTARLISICRRVMGSGTHSGKAGGEVSASKAWAGLKRGCRARASQLELGKTEDVLWS